MERVTHCQIHDLPNPSCVNDQISRASWEGHIPELVVRYINDRKSDGRDTGRRSIFEESVQPMEEKIALEAKPANCLNPPMDPDSCNRRCPQEHSVVRRRLNSYSI